MFATTLFALAQATFLPLGSLDDDEFCTLSMFTDDGSELVVWHAQSESLTRLDVTTGVVASRFEVDDEVQDLERIPGTDRFVALSDEALYIFSHTPLAPIATVPISAAFPIDVTVGLGGTRAIVNGFGNEHWVAVIDLVAGVEERVIRLPDAMSIAGGAVELTTLLADDDRTIVTLGLDGVQTPTLFGFDASTGSLSASAPVPTPEPFHSLTMSADRTTVGYVTTRFLPVRTSVARLEARTLALLDRTRFGGIASLQTEIDPTGSRAAIIRSGNLHTFDLDGTVKSAGSAGVVTSFWPNAQSFTMAADWSRAFVWSGIPSQGGAVFGPAGNFVNSIGELPSPSLSLTEVAVSPSTRAFAYTRGPVTDRAVILDANGPVTLNEWNSGFGEELDGPFATLPIDAERIAIAAAGTGQLLIHDARSGAELGRMAGVAEQPVALERRVDGMLLVGHADGTLVVVDPSGPVEVARIDLDGPIFEIIASDINHTALVRTSHDPTDRLWIVDTTIGAASALASIDLSGRWTAPDLTLVVPAGNSLAIDRATGRAIAVSSDPPTLDLLDLTSATLADTEVIPDDVALPRIALAPDGSRVFCAGSHPGPKVFAYTVTAGAIGLDWSVVTGGGFGVTSPLGLAVSPDGAVVYANLSPAFDPVIPSNGPGIVALDAATGAQVADLRFAPYAQLIGAAADYLLLTDPVTLEFAQRAANSLQVVDAIGVGFASSPFTSLTVAPEFGLACGPAQRALFLGPAQEGVYAIDLFTNRVQSLCGGGAPNATGEQARLQLFGSPFAGDTVIAAIDRLQPASMFGVLVVGTAITQPTTLPNGIGELCVGGTVGRLIAPPQLTGPDGAQRYPFDSSALMTSAGTFQVQSGETWVFQLWHRDLLPSGAATSNTSTAQALMFR